MVIVSMCFLSLQDKKTMFLVVANWKMNGSLKTAAEFEQGIKSRNAEIVLCPPFPLLMALKGQFRLGAQNCHHLTEGAHTGEVSASLIKELGAEYVIVGHSERREAGENSELIAQKAAAAQKAGLKVIICVGEKEGEDMENVVKEQLSESLPANKNNIIIAYEPVWAIGSGRTPTGEQIEKAHGLIAAITGLKVIYGGSVKPANTAEIARIKNVSGLLVGGASLDVNSFNAIIKAI
jgi:triosephosphate isomerase